MEGIEVAPGIGKIGSRYSVAKFLGKGAFADVYEGFDLNTNQRVAIKILNGKGLKHLDDEMTAMLTIRHENVLKGIEYSENEHDFTNADGSTQKKITFLVTELAEEADLFDWICYGERFEEPMARYFFKQLILGLQACHNTNFAHRDLKPENILLNSDFVLKIADFGLTGPISGRDGESGLLTTRCGTPGYAAPEMYGQLPYEG